MERRKFVTAAALGSVAVSAGCAQQECASDGTSSSFENLTWKMVTSWPQDFPGLGTAANNVAKAITRMSGGRLTVRVYAAGDLVPAFEVFDAVSRGTAELGHSAAYYWKGKSPATQFFAGVPFGLTANEMNAWLFYGGGMELWRELYGQFNLVPFAAGNTNVQMGGWFNKEINTVDDLKGLKMRIPGLGGEVLARAGGTPVSLPGGEIFTALQSGTIDATEWVGPYNDQAFGLFRAAQYYYYPGWHEPGTTLECMVNKEAFEALPDDLQAIVEAACRQANDDLLAEYEARNATQLMSLTEEHGVELRQFPTAVMDKLRTISTQVLEEIAANDPMSGRILESLNTFKKRNQRWRQISDVAYLEARDG